MLPSPDEIQRWREVEATSRRNVQPHPDACPKLVIRGVEWAVPPSGVRIVPTFGAEGVTLSADEQHEWKCLDAVRARPEQRVRYCTECGQPVGEDMSLNLSDAEHAAWLGAVVGLTAELLKARYSVTDTVLAELLAMEPGDLPEWVVPVYNWALGAELYAESAPVDWTYEFPAEPEPVVEPEPVAWWKFWRAG